MNKLMAILMCVFIVQPTALVFAAGLGDTVKDVRAQYGAKVSLDETYYVFGKPPRVSRIDIESRKFIGAVPTVAEFVKSIKPLLPSDAKLTAARRKPAPWPNGKVEIYSFKSAALAKLPNIKDAVIDSPIGTFTAFLHFDGDQVVNGFVVMGLPGDVDLRGAKKISKNPFK
ncbi:hypothetical protein [Geobacter sp. SVR]|uniref:hypothetical protein n=1 Tax=Geobacter sp. SVR TaxID=2495594 RepID=UPI0015650566|nr:hypothetical protein [Geobacter sp. SVR]